LIDGYRVTSIGAGGKVEIPVPPGRHQVKARLDFMGSQPVEIEITPEELRRLTVRWNFPGRNPLTFGYLLAIFVVFGFATIPLGRVWFRDVFERMWFERFTDPLFILPWLLPLAYMVYWRNHFLSLEEIPILDTTARQVALPRVQPLRMRIGIRGLMIAVAIPAVLLGAGVEWARLTRGDYFRNKARMHALSEARCRQFEQDWIRRADEWAKTGLTAGLARQSAAGAAAKAEYHAAMKRKYEEATSRH
jgi:hypothetical protein